MQDDLTSIFNEGAPLHCTVLPILAVSRSDVGVTTEVISHFSLMISIIRKQLSTWMFLWLFSVCAETNEYLQF